MTRDEIKFCPVCGSKNIDKMPMESKNTGVAVDYYCEKCESNGDIDIMVQSKTPETLEEEAKEATETELKTLKDIEIFEMGELKGLNANITDDGIVVSGTGKYEDIISKKTLREEAKKWVEEMEKRIKNNREAFFCLEHLDQRNCTTECRRLGEVPYEASDITAAIKTLKYIFNLEDD